MEIINTILKLVKLKFECDFPALGEVLDEQRKVGESLIKSGTYRTFGDASVVATSSRRGWLVPLGRCFLLGFGHFIVAIIFNKASDPAMSRRWDHCERPSLDPSGEPYWAEDVALHSTAVLSDF